MLWHKKYAASVTRLISAAILEAGISDLKSAAWRMSC
jgi:hypothetical protein